jgi:hypothetical protein
MNQAAPRCDIHLIGYLLELGNEPGLAGAKAVAQPGSHHATISSISPEPGWSDASTGATATIHR